MAAITKLRTGWKFARQVTCSCAYSSKDEPSDIFPAEFRGVGQRYKPARPPSDEPEDKRDFNLDLMLFLHQRLDISIDGYKKWRQNKLEEAIVHNQRFIEERLNILGPDLAAAHFLVHRGGGVKFRGSEAWIRKDAKNKYYLPNKYIPGLFIEALDVGGVEIVFTGLINLENLEYCRWISFRESPRVDDFYMDWLTNYKETLECLDISGCSLLTERGVSSLARLRKLKLLNLSNLPRLKHPELTCLLLDDELPDCKIVGIDYMNPNVLHKSEGDEIVIEQTEEAKRIE